MWVQFVQVNILIKVYTYYYITHILEYQFVHAQHKALPGYLAVTFDSFMSNTYFGSCV